MRLGVHLVDFAFAGGPESIALTLAKAGQLADEGGIANLSLMDHYLQMEEMGGPDQPMLEGYTTLGYLAGQTSKVELQLLVTGVTYRHPGLLAKIVSTLDVLSGGRAALGIGAAWYAREHEALGVPFPPVPERFERLEETLQIVLQMWSSNDGRFDGRHYALAETLNNPAPLSRPHPPIMIGGTGERKTLRLVAKYGNACNFFAGDGAAGPETVASKLAVLREHCDEQGTDYNAIRKTILYVGAGRPDSSGASELIDQLSRYAEVGISQAHLMPGPTLPTNFISDISEYLIPTLAAV
ncbi:MAG: LLM class F420-dependent oxidoreductase [Actinomycetes bacterium]